MSIARKLALLLTMALAAMALAATNASATEGITVEKESTGAACNPCTIHVVGESALLAFHTIRVSTCEDEFNAVINANGNGEVTTWDGTSTDPLGNCTREQCTVQPDNTPREHWPFTSEETGDNEINLGIEFCLSPKDGDMSSKSKCDVDVHVTEEETNNHHYFFDLDQECNVGGVPVEVEGEWESEGQVDAEFVHAE